ncbi:MAG: hypothetical protein HFF02_09655 [Erysipelotrichaceae bacterium]|nr:hypothetical protein [Erysipelotrichaceae bacterium]
MRLRLAKGLCAAGLLFTCFGCSSSGYDDEAVEALVTAINGMAEANSMALTGDITANGEKDGTPIKVKISLDGEANYEKAEDLQMKFTMGMNANGLSMNDLAKIYIKDNTMYMDFMNEKQKQAFPEELSQLEDLPDFSIHMDADQLKNSFDTIKYEDKENGVIKLEMNDTIHDSFVTGMKSSANKMDLKDYTLTMTVKNNRLSEIKMNLDLLTEGEALEMEIAFAFDKFDQIKKIEFPDFKEFKESNSDSLLGNDLDSYL